LIHRDVRHRVEIRIPTPLHAMHGGFVG
jgi:hypothetical protein